MRRRLNRKWVKGPTFVAVFADGTKVRMTTNAQRAEFDWERGASLAYAAWLSRHGFDSRINNDSVCPSDMRCWFERDRKRVTQIMDTREAA